MSSLIAGESDLRFWNGTWGSVSPPLVDWLFFFGVGKTTFAPADFVIIPEEVSPPVANGSSRAWAAHFTVSRFQGFHVIHHKNRQGVSQGRKLQNRPSSLPRVAPRFPITSFCGLVRFAAHFKGLYYSTVRVHHHALQAACSQSCQDGLHVQSPRGDVDALRRRLSHHISQSCLSIQDGRYRRIQDG